MGRQKAKIQQINSVSEKFIYYFLLLKWKKRNWTNENFSSAIVCLSGHIRLTSDLFTCHSSKINLGGKLSAEENPEHFVWYQDFMSLIHDHFSCVLGGLRISCLPAFFSFSHPSYSNNFSHLHFVSSILNTLLFLKLFDLFYCP